jgi:trk system potassium uptake protein
VPSFPSWNHYRQRQLPRKLASAAESRHAGGVSRAMPHEELHRHGETNARPRVASAPALSALLVVGGPALVALMASESRIILREMAVACGVLVSLAGLTMARGLRISRLFALAGLVLGLWTARPVLMRAPDFMLLFAVIAVAISSALWHSRVDEHESSLRTTLTTPAAVQSGAVCAAAVWMALAIGESSYPRAVRLAAATCLTLPSAFLVGWVVRSLRGGGRSAILPLACLLAGLALAWGLAAQPVWALTAWAVGLGLAVPFLRSRDDAESVWGILLEHPARLIVSTFAALCMFGTLVLALPASSTTGHSLGLLNAAFTAVSAVCVTGLIVVDTASAFTGLGQAAILLLIQVGGLGIMTFYTVTLRALGRRLGLRHELILTDVAQVDGQSSLYRALGLVLGLTVAIELCGAVVLCACFVRQGLDWPAAAWRGIFTAVSAFCNAGFALETSSLMAHQRWPLILAIVGVLAVLGGLAPPVVSSLPALLRRRALPLQTELVWWMTILLFAAGFLVYLAFEWSHSLVGLPWWHKLSNAAFQSAMRTAGFNSVDMAATHPATQVFMIALMFIGGSPGGTAGGIKTTTAALLILAVMASLRGRLDVTVLRRRIVHTSVYRAAAVATVGVLSAVAVLLALMLTQRLPPEMATFEAVSALATVGLSTGGTALLDGVGKVIIMLAMFVGRVGPLTLFLLLGEYREGRRWQFPDAEVDVG